MKHRWLSLLISLGLAAGVAQCGTWTDRKEYDLALSIRSEATLQKRLDLLDAWTKSYPKTDMRGARLELYLHTYQALGNRQRMFETSRLILSDQSTNTVGLFWCALLLPEIENPSPEMLDAGEKSARRLISGLDTFFSSGAKPAPATQSEWEKEKSGVEVIAHRTLGWAHWRRGEIPAAEEEFTICLQKDPERADVSTWLGIILALETGKQVPALWHLARGSRGGSEIALSQVERRQVNSMFERVYASYHGSPDGIDDLRASVTKAAFPPSEFSVEPATVVAARKAEAELGLSNPELAAWMGIRRQLDAPSGDTYFSASLQSKPLPRLKGTVKKALPARNPREFILLMDDPANSEITLRLSSSLNSYSGPGAKLAFQGTAQAFTREPFGMIVSAEPGSIEVLSAKTGSSR